ncbi:hypothetical protein Tco_1396680, partial [Tanacetum coccineum]
RKKLEWSTFAIIFDLRTLRPQPLTNMGGNLPITRGTSAQYPQGGYVPQAFANNNLPSYNGFGYPVVTPSNNYPFYIRPMYTQPNMSAYSNPSFANLFADPTGCVTLFVHWIEDYPLPDELKMPSHVGSYNGKGDPDNYLHLFEGDIRMQKYSMPIAYHMFTYTLKTLPKYVGIVRKQIFGLHEDQRISGFVHGLRIRNLVDFFSTDLLTTYKGLMEKTYTWFKAREVATNGAPNDQRESFDSPREIMATNKVTKTFEQPPRMLGNWRSHDMTKYCHFHEDHGHDTNDSYELRHQIEEVVKSRQLSHPVKGIKKGKRKASDTQ